MKKSDFRRNLAVGIFLIFLFMASAMQAQSLHTAGDMIFVQGSNYLLQIDRATGMVAVQNSTGQSYTRFPLFARPLPASDVSSAPVLSWKISPAAVGMTARDRATQKVLFQADLKFRSEAFEVHFGILPKVRDPGYEVVVVNGSWPWGLGIDTSFARKAISLSGKTFPKGLGAHAYSRVGFTFKAPVAFRSFEALVGVDDEVGKNGSVEFQVMADGRKAAESGVITGGRQPRLLQARIEGAKTIELIVNDAGDGEANDDADWANARFISAGGETIYVSDLISGARQSLELFSVNGRGFETAGWTNMFTPEPDIYYSDSGVMVDARQDLDGQRFFAPAPLNLSFKTPAGWFSVGLCQLPDATGFRFQNDRFLIDYPWDKLKLPDDRPHWITPLCFTFNQSEWSAIDDYRTYLLKYKYVSDTPIERKPIPGWWMDPLICTWSEQCLDAAAQASPRFTSDWVKRYVLGQEKALGVNRFTVIIDDKWQRKYGDPRPDPSRFGKMRELIDWIHRRGHKVLLWWRCWFGELDSLPEAMGLLDKGAIDATHPLFEEYVRRAMRAMLGGGAGELDADGFKVDYIFDVRAPATAVYAQPSLGVGLREVYRFASAWYREAKKVKKDCLITFSGPDPHFSLVQDMSRINDAGRDGLQRQRRARVSALSSPNVLIDGDGADMFVSLADYHHIVSSSYGTPSLYSLTAFSDGPISEDMRRVTAKIFRLAAMKKPGHPLFRDFGHWQYVRDGKVVAESFQDGTAFVVFPDAHRALALSTKKQDMVLPLRNVFPTRVRTEEGKTVEFKVLPDERILIPQAQRGEVYTVWMRK